MEKQRREEPGKKIEEERRSEKRKNQKKQDEGARKGRMSRNTGFFQCFVAPEGQTVGWLKRRVRSHLARWEMKNCRPLWHESHMEVWMSKKHQPRSTFGSWDVQKKSAQRLWCEARFEVKMSKISGVLEHGFGSWALEKVHAAVAQSAFPSQNRKNAPSSDHCLDVAKREFFLAGAMDCRTFSKALS